MAAEAGMTLAEFGVHAQGHPEIDRELDDRLEARAAEPAGCVIESRLAGWLATRAGCWPCPRVGRLRRRGAGGPGGRAGRDTLDQALLDNAERSAPRTGPLPGRLRASTSTDRSTYDLVLDSTSEPPEALAATIIVEATARSACPRRATAVAR